MSAAGKKITVSVWFLVLLAIGVLILTLALRQIHDLDLGFHLRGGQWMLQHRSFHHLDVFTYTVNQHEYIAMYWLFQIALFIVYQIAGYGGLTVINALLILSAFFLLWQRMNNQSHHPGLVAAGLLISVLIMELRFGVRPEIVTWIFLALQLLILAKYERAEKNLLFLLPVSQLLWVNTHGLFILGWVIMAAYGIGFFIHDRGRFKKLLPWLITGIMASLINPYGWHGLTFPFYLFTRLQASNIFRNNITELTPPLSSKALFFLPHLPLYLFYIFAAGVMILVLSTIQRRRSHDLIITGAFLYLALTAVRNIPLFIMVSLPIAVRSGSELLRPLRAAVPPRLKARLGRIISFALTGTCLLFAGRVITNAFYAERGGGHFGLGLDENVHPVGVADFINKHRLTGRILNDLNHGSWLIWQIPQPVFIDGRLEVMREDFFTEYYRSYDQGGLSKLIVKYHPELVVFDHSYPEAALWDLDLKTNPAWRLIYADAVSALWCRAGYAENLRRFDFQFWRSKFKIEPALTADAWNILRRKLPGRFMVWLKGFYQHRENPLALYRLGLYAALSFDFTSAEAFYLAALEKTPRPPADAWIKLGTVYYFLSDLEKSLYCFNRGLAENPKNEVARRRRDEIRQLLGR